MPRNNTALQEARTNRPSAYCPSFRLVDWHLAFVCWLLSSGQLHSKRAALSRAAFHVNFSTQQIDILFHKSQPQASVQAVAVPRRIDPGEALEDEVDGVGADADPRVADFQTQPAGAPLQSQI